MKISEEEALQLGFSPDKAIRDFDLGALEGTELPLEVEVIETPHSKKSLMVSTRITSPTFIASDYLSWEEATFLTAKERQVLEAEKRVTITRCVRTAFFLEARNGGRSSSVRAKTYRHYFEAQRANIYAWWRGGLSTRIGRPGNLDEADIFLDFDGFNLELQGWGLKAPSEWYSEVFADHPTLKFSKGFYETADEATAAFSSQPVEDFFGTRFFPVLVFPIEVGMEALKEAARPAKSMSEVLVTPHGLVVGTRCKAYEYDQVIELTYAKGGRVAKGVQWDWN